MFHVAKCRTSRHFIVHNYKRISTAIRKMAAEEGSMWSFGFGSNMDRIALETKKHVKILEESPAILKGWSFSFIKGVPYAEPAYANVKPDPEGEVHGLAFLMTKDSIAELDRTESGYKKAIVDLHAYDGRVLKGFVYAGNANDTVRPSKRYMGVLIKGATQAGLKREYIEKLKALPTYVPSEEVLAKRKALPQPESLPSITAQELSKYNGKNKDLAPRVAVFGYVFEIQNPGFGYFGSHKGRDITTRMMHQFHGIGMDDHDDAGQPPYPLLDQLTGDQTEFISCWQDFYNASGKCVAYVKEFLDQQKSGKSDWALPKI